ncbi:MAG TPA: hypothetical protein VD970_00045 [Acetobacteraceae bacterium]|nr:hypothetical protein [Acetobacteraceae bacterium]
MSGCRVFFLALYGLLAFLGLVLFGKGGDLPMTVFGGLLMLFGLLMGYRTIGRHFDDAPAQH